MQYTDASSLTANTVVKNIEQRLAQEFSDTTLCSQYAWWIVEAITGYTKTTLLTQSVVFSSLQLEQIEQWLRAIFNDKKPIQYLLGKVPFNTVEIKVQPPILIPRPETEEWCANLISLLEPLKREKLTVLDLCCGSGCVAISLAKALSTATVYAIDIDGAAVTLTQQNATHNQITNVICLQSDLFNNLSDIKFDLIVSNPPYIAPQEVPSLDASVKNWEAMHALVADDDGLAIIKKIIAQVPHFLKKNTELHKLNIPQLIIEIGYLQGPTVIDLLKNANYNTIQLHKDLAGRDRTVRARVDNVAIVSTKK